MSYLGVLLLLLVPALITAISFGISAEPMNSRWRRRRANRDSSRTDIGEQPETRP